MSIDEQEIFRWVGYLVTVIAASAGIYGFVKIVYGRIDRQIGDHPSIKELCEDTAKIKHEVGLLRQSVDFFEKYFIEPLKLKGHYNDNEDTKG